MFKGNHAGQRIAGSYVTLPPDGTEPRPFGYDGRIDEEARRRHRRELQIWEDAHYCDPSTYMPYLDGGATGWVKINA